MSSGFMFVPSCRRRIGTTETEDNADLQHFLEIRGIEGNDNR